MVRTFVLRGLILIALGSLSACVPPAPAPGPTTVELVNTTSLFVSPNLYVSGTATNAEELFAGANLVTVYPNRHYPELYSSETVKLTFEHEQIQSLGVKTPTLFDALVLDVTKSKDQIFLLREADFEDAATVRFVYFMDGDTFNVRVETQ